MRKGIVRSTIAGAVLAVAMGLAQIEGDTDPPHLSIEELTREPTRWAGQMIHLRGTVQPTSIQRTATAEWKFTMAGGGRTLRVRYVGIPPNTLQNDAEVLLLGELRDRQFDALRLLVKIPTLN